MLQSVAWLSFSVFGGNLKIENWKLQSIFNFCLSAKTFKIVDRTTQEGGGGVHSHGNFLSLVPSPQISFPPCKIFTPPPPYSPTLYFSGEEEARNSYLSRSHFYQKFTPSFSLTFIPTMFYSMASEKSLWLHHPLQHAPIRSLRSL